MAASMGGWSSLSQHYEDPAGRPRGNVEEQEQRSQAGRPVTVCSACACAQVLLRHGLVTQEVADQVSAFIAANQTFDAGAPAPAAPKQPPTTPKR